MKDKDACKKYIELHEGRKEKAYVDTKKHPTIGIGFNLDRADAKQWVESLGLNYDAMKEGKIGLTNSHIEQLYEADLATAIADAKKFFPRFDELDAMRQIVLVDMVFNLGLSRLNKFKKFKLALEQNDYEEAAQQMEQSRWAKQVNSRSLKANIPAMRNGEMPYNDIALRSLV
jgi:GH24 family phage-related lysozyme (muramidase)